MKNADAVLSEGMNKMYNVVLVGCGHMGETHLSEFHTLENVCLYGVVDLDIERARSFAKRYNAKSYGTSYKEYLEDENTDIVICATYASSHLMFLKECVKYGKHLLCEKPITTTVEEAKEYVSIVKSAPIKVQIGYILRFNESYRKIAEMIHDGAIGHPIVMRMNQNHHVMDWKKYSALLADASPIVDCGVHYVDVCRWFTQSEVAEVDGIASRIGDETPEDSFNYGLMTIRMEDGSIAYYEAGWANTISADNTKEFFGPKGRITLTEACHRHSCQEEGDLIEYYTYPEKEYITINCNCKRRPTGEELAHLIRMIEDNVEANPTIDDVYKSFSCVMKADKILKEKLYK